MDKHIKISYRNFSKLVFYLLEKELSNAEKDEILLKKEVVNNRIKNLYGENINDIQSKIVDVELEFIYKYIWYEDIMFADFTNEFKMKLARVLKRKQTFEQYIYQLLIKEFPNDKIEQQYYVYVKNPFNDYKQPFRVDFYFLECNIVVEVDEIDHKSREVHDKLRENSIKNELGCTFIRIKEYSNEKTIEQFINEIKIIKEQITRE